jgi:hypothetical protein
MKRIATVALTLMTALAFATGGRAEEKAKAVSCPKCESVWVKVPNAGKAKTYTSVKKMACDDCRTAVENFFAGGAFAHTCKTCGDLEACEIEQAQLNEETRERAATCSKCQVTWVREPRQVGKITIYRTTKSMNCETCKKAAAEYLEGGALKSDCEKCGDALTACH